MKLQEPGSMQPTTGPLKMISNWTWEQSPLFVPMRMWSTPPGMLAFTNGLEAAPALVIISERGTFDTIAQGDLTEQSAS